MRVMLVSCNRRSRLSQRYKSGGCGDKDGWKILSRTFCCDFDNNLYLGAVMMLRWSDVQPSRLDDGGSTAPDIGLAASVRRYLAMALPGPAGGVPKPVSEVPKVLHLILGLGVERSGIYLSRGMSMDMQTLFGVGRSRIVQSGRLQYAMQPRSGLKLNNGGQRP